ncbi:MAG: Crp/Fnr family transcriptional regulator [Thermoflexibacteraceae bacterium]|jgi:CRP/FNR family cyclic AMP-dependent transcriptional regulator
MFNLFAKKYSNREKVLFRFLRKNNLFDKLEDEEIAEFLPFLHLRSYHYNEVIFFRNDPSQAIYIIKSGNVRISLDVEAHFEDLLVLASGESFGDNAILEQTMRSYNAICNSEVCEVYAIPQFNIHDIFNHHVEIKAKMLQGLARYYDRYMINLAKSYRNTFGLFDLANVYALTQHDILREK